MRLPNINRPLSKHHEFVTAVSLRVIQIWYDEGASTLNFNPVMNFSGDANKSINNHASTTSGMKDKEGNYFYISHPPFGYIFPYFFHKILHIRPTVLSLQIFHLVLNFISAFFIYLIVCLLGQQRPFSKIYIAGIIGYIVYLFNPSVLWFQSNTYMSDMAVHLFFILGVYTMLKLLMRKRFFSVKYLIYYALFLFLMIYTSWLGLFFAFSVFVYSLIKLRTEKVFLPLLIITIVSTYLALWLIIKQYSSIAGLEPFISQMLDRVAERGSAGGEGIIGFFSKKATELKILLFNYLTSYLPIFLLIATFGWLVITRAKLRIVFTKNGYRFLWLSTLPVLLLHFFLLNYSGHDFVSLYGSLFLAVLIAILYDKLREAQTLSKWMLNGGITLIVLLSLGMYYYINMPGNYSHKGYLYGESKEIGEFVKKEAQPDEVVFIMGNVLLDPQVIIYAQRNIKKVNSKDEMNSFLEKHPLNKGIFFTVKDYENIDFERIN